MCNHTLHNDQPDHILKITYMFKAGTTYRASFGDKEADSTSTDHSCGPAEFRSCYEVAIPVALDLQLLGWRNWLKSTLKRFRDEYHEERREPAALRDPLWSYEDRIDVCNDSSSI
jgi:hypothetical protein